MGLLDGPQQANLAEVFPPGTPFRLEAVSPPELDPASERRLAKVSASPVTDPGAGQWFGVWGSLADQAGEAEPGELPMIVTLSNETGVWRFAPHGPPPILVEDPETGKAVEQPMRVAPEAHMLPDAPSEPPAHGAPVIDTPPQSSPPPVPDGGHRQPVSTDPPTVTPTPIDDSQTFQPGKSHG
jgi:hypothetical protein